MSDGENPFQAVRDQLVGAMGDIHDEMVRLAGSVKPYGQTALSPQESDLVWEHPISLYPGEVDEATGLPLTNAQAAARWYAEVAEVTPEHPQGKHPERWIALAEGYRNRQERRARR